MEVKTAQAIANIYVRGKKSFHVATPIGFAVVKLLDGHLKFPTMPQFCPRMSLVPRTGQWPSYILRSLIKTLSGASVNRLEIQPCTRFNVLASKRSTLLSILHGGSASVRAGTCKLGCARLNLCHFLSDLKDTGRYLIQTAEHTSASATEFILR